MKKDKWQYLAVLAVTSLLMLILPSLAAAQFDITSEAIETPVIILEQRKVEILSRLYTVMQEYRKTERFVIRLLETERILARR